MADPTIVSVQSGVYVFPQFLPDAVCCFSTREFEASRDIPLFLDSIGIPRERFATVEQSHGDQIILATGENLSSIPEADGLVTDQKDLALVIRTADCVPLFLFDPETPAIGICHAGWRGTRKGVVLRTLEMFNQSFGSNLRFLEAAMGPAICSHCYEVGEEFRDYFPGFVEPRGQKYFFDLRGAIRNQLLEAGLQPEAIWDSSCCTSCSINQFYSARKEGAGTGRLISAAVLK